MPSLKEEMRSKRPLLGGFIFSSDSNISELYAEAGYDFVIIDTEHALNDLRIVQTHVRACAASGIHALVLERVNWEPRARRRRVHRRRVLGDVVFWHRVRALEIFGGAETDREPDSEKIENFSVNFARVFWRWCVSGCVVCGGFREGV